MLLLLLLLHSNAELSVWGPVLAEQLALLWGLLCLVVGAFFVWICRRQLFAPDGFWGKTMGKEKL